MIVWRQGIVTALGREWDGAIECTVELSAGPGRALAYPALVGRPQVGDRVLLNTTALDRGLGTGGYALVAAIPDRLPDPAPAREAAVPPAEGAAGAAGPGHLVKARYTPLQAMVLGVDEQESPHHGLLAEADDLHGMPVVAADLHSAVPAIIAGVRQRRPDARVAYVYTDGGALPAWFSRTVAGLRDAGWLTACVTVGQAFGGDLEAVSVHTGLLAARHVVQADLAIVAQGPGNLGTGTRWGYSGVAAGEALNAAGVLGGRPVAALRVSGADRRERHLGISHHSLTAYGRVALVPAEVPVPILPPSWGEPADLGELVRAQAAALGAPAGRHRLVEVPLDGLDDALRGCPVPLSTMGRGLDGDPAAFLASAAAGRHTASLLR